MKDELVMVPVGRIARSGETVRIEISSGYRRAMRGLSAFSHVWILYWLDRLDNVEGRQTLLVHPRRRKELPRAGAFATRTPCRPNPVGISLCRIKAVHGAVIEIDSIDAYDASPVVDVKPYIPDADSALDAQTPWWASSENAYAPSRTRS